VVEVVQELFRLGDISFPSIPFSRSFAIATSAPHVAKGDRFQQSEGLLPQSELDFHAHRALRLEVLQKIVRSGAPALNSTHFTSSLPAMATG